jgi:hypothetical protein
LLIRFRLFSDPFANGWGWVIDDLKINPLIDSVEDRKYNDFTIYPNPGKGLVNFNFESQVNGKQPRYTVINGSGAVVRIGYLSSDTTQVIDISGLPEGFYIIAIYDNFTVRTVKYSLIH